MCVGWVGGVLVAATVFSGARERLQLGHEGANEGLAAVSFQEKSVRGAEVSESIQSPLLPGGRKVGLRETGL